MVRTYTVTKGHQYDEHGVNVVREMGRRSSWTRYNPDGTRHSGDILCGWDTRDDEPVVLAAVRRVVETGESETLTLGAPEPKASPKMVAEMERHERLMAEMDREDSDY